MSTLTEALPEPKIRHEWYQTDDEVVLSIFVRNVKPEDLTVDLEKSSVSIYIKVDGSADKFFGLDPLCREIDVSKCSYRVIPAKIELKLKKQQVGTKWSRIEGEDPKVTVGDLLRPSYPTSAKKQTNWDAIAKSAVDEEEKSAKEHDKDPNAGGDKKLNELFQKLYADADDNQRRAMVKSYQESNGTTLSTDWSEVSKKKLETNPPDSMIAKKWGA